MKQFKEKFPESWKGTKKRDEGECGSLGDGDWNKITKIKIEIARTDHITKFEWKSRGKHLHGLLILEANLQGHLF